MNDVRHYDHGIVQKPWGYEYLMYDNGQVALWCLHIRHGARTSMHCHPKKKTGLVVLDGDARVSFLNDSVTLRPVSKLMIREGLFHSTAALSTGGLTLIESETPCDKTDLVRLEDEYGREDAPYEGPDAVAPITADCVRLPARVADGPTIVLFGNCELRMEHQRDVSALSTRPSAETIIVLDGGLATRDGQPVLSVGDVVTTETLKRLAARFSAPKGLSTLTIRRMNGQPETLDGSPI